MASLLSFDPLIIIPFLGGLIGMSVGLVTIWNSFKNNQQKQKTDTQAAAVASENRLKEYFDLRLRILDTDIANIKSNLHTMNETYTQKLEDRSRFFTDWVKRLEEKIENGKS